MKLIGPFILVILLMSGCSAVVVERPTDQQIAVIPTAPGAGFVWINDSWTYSRNEHKYRPSRGHWVKPRRSSAVWVDGYWVQTRRGWKYINGHWRY
jgi:uncharacterized protein YceK